MKLENQVCSLELAKKLKELGVDQRYSEFAWAIGGDKCKDNWTLVWREDPSYSCSKFYSAFTVAELGEMLPDKIEFKRPMDSRGTDIYYIRMFKRGIDYVGDGERRILFNSDYQQIHNKSKTEADARAKMLIYLLENKLITT